MAEGVKAFSRKSGYHRPHTFVHGYKANLRKAVKYVQEDGMKIEKAVALAYGVAPSTWFKWKENAETDIANGFTGTELMYVYNQLMTADSSAERRLVKRATEIATDEVSPNVDMLKFLLQTRHGYKKTSAKEVEVATKEDLSFNINIVDSKKKDE